MQIVTDSVIDRATTVTYMLGNLIPPMDASCSSSLSTMSVVNIANDFQIQSPCKSLSWSLRVVQIECELIFDEYITHSLWW